MPRHNFCLVFFDDLTKQQRLAGYISSGRGCRNVFSPKISLTVSSNYVAADEVWRKIPMKTRTPGTWSRRVAGVNREISAVRLGCETNGATRSALVINKLVLRRPKQRILPHLDGPSRPPESSSGCWIRSRNGWRTDGTRIFGRLIDYGDGPAGKAQRHRVASAESPILLFTASLMPRQIILSLLRVNQCQSWRPELANARQHFEKCQLRQCCCSYRVLASSLLVGHVRKTPFESADAWSCAIMHNIKRFRSTSLSNGCSC